MSINIQRFSCQNLFVPCFAIAAIVTKSPTVATSDCYRNEIIAKFLLCSPLSGYEDGSSFFEVFLHLRCSILNATHFHFTVVTACRTYYSVHNRTRIFKLNSCISQDLKLEIGAWSQTWWQGYWCKAIYLNFPLIRNSRCVETQNFCYCKFRTSQIRYSEIDFSISETLKF